MKQHYKGKYDLNPESLPHGEHKPGAVKFKEAESSKQMPKGAKTYLYQFNSYWYMPEE